MTAPPALSRQIRWQSVTTVISAALLIGAEVFGGAYAGAWALAYLFNLGTYGHYGLQVALFVLGCLVMVAFVRSAMRVEPFVASE